MLFYDGAVKIIAGEGDGQIYIFHRAFYRAARLYGIAGFRRRAELHKGGIAAEHLGAAQVKGGL